MTEMICIVCPKGCHLRVDEDNDYTVTGAGCEKGLEYGRVELLSPTRVLTSTVKTKDAAIRRCPVRTAGAIPKGKIFEAMDAINRITLTAPIRTGQVVIPDLLGTGVDLIATRDID